MRSPTVELLLIILFFAVCGCASEGEVKIPKHIEELDDLTVYPAGPQPTREIQLQREQTFGSSEEMLMGRLGDIAVDSSGRVFIADVQNQSIHVFQPGGRFISQLGRNGKGPSEFSSIKSLQIRNNQLHVYNFNQQQVSVFTLDRLDGDKTIFLARNRGNYQGLKRAYPSIDNLYVRNNSTYIAKFISDSSQEHQKWQNVDMKGLFYQLDDNGMIASKLFEFTSETRTQLKAFLYLIKPFFGKVLTVFSSDNRIYWAGPDHFLIKVYSPGGVYEHAFYHPYERIPLTQKSAIEAEVPDLFIKSMESMDLPPTWPVLTDMKIDDQDRLWIATTVEDMKVYEWWVLENSGELVTKFEWPRDKPIEEVRNGKLYTRETDEETDLQKIVRYDIELTND